MFERWSVKSEVRRVAGAHITSLHDGIFTVAPAFYRKWSLKREVKTTLRTHSKEANAVSWPRVDPQYVVNELLKVDGFYSTFKNYSKLSENQKKKVHTFYSALDVGKRQEINTNALKMSEEASKSSGK